MTRNERHRVYDAASITLSSLGLAFGIPTLINAHDSVALIAAFFLLLGWVSNTLLYLYRMKG